MNEKDLVSAVIWLGHILNHLQMMVTGMRQQHFMAKSVIALEKTMLAEEQKAPGKLFDDRFSCAGRLKDEIPYLSVSLGKAI